MTHGAAAYRRGCRCADCRAANATYHRAYRASHRAERLAYHRQWMAWWRREKKLRLGAA